MSLLKMRTKLPYLLQQVCRRSLSDSKRKAQEIEIPVAYGHLSAKEWGPPNGRPVLALHGWQDNAGSFDTLIPKLDPSLRIVALDLPGHGLSSHKPDGTYYNFMETLIDIKYALAHLGWTNVTLLAHSMGAALALFYASIYPDEVDALVCLDVIKPLTVAPEKQPESTRKAIKQLMTFSDKRKIQAPSYTYEQAVLRLLEGMSDFIIEESAHVLLKRGAKPSKDGLTFSRDIRVQAHLVQNMDVTAAKAYMGCIKSELLIIRAKDGLNVEEPVVLQEFLDIYRRNCTNFQYVEVEGAHHVHLNHPERVADYINVFFKSNDLV